MSFLDFLSGIGGALKDTVIHIANDPQQQYNFGKLAGLQGQDRHMWNLGHNDGSAEWQRLRRLEKAYNSGYDVGRAERKRSNRLR